MSTAVLSPPNASFRRAATTPQILWRFLWAMWIADLVVLGCLVGAGRVHYAALSTIGKDSAPSIIASQRIKSALADMDADAANALLGEPGADGPALQDYQLHRQEAATALISAAQNITYGDAERIPILHVQLGLGTYETLVQRARDLHDERNASFLSAYNQAAQVLDDTILPAADDLDRANLRELDLAYAGLRSRSLFARTAFGLAAALLLLLLAAAQLFLLNRTRRVINIPLFAATLLLVVFTILSLNQLSSAHANLKRAKEDAFTSIHALWQARAVAYAANADESRFLLDPNHASERTEAFFAKRDLLVRLPLGTDYRSIAAASSAGRTFTGPTGFLIDELNNITFPGEREAAIDTLLTFGRYVDVDSRIRNLERSGQHRDAVTLCIGAAPGSPTGPSNSSTTRSSEP
jgi:hypothetical protein